MAEISFTVNSNNSGRKTLVASDTNKRYKTTSITITVTSLTNSASQNSNTVNFYIGFTDWTNNY